MEESNLLPLGSIVYLKEGILPIMIVTRQPLMEINDDIYFFDYAGINHLSGLSNLNEIVYFNQENISTIQFQGYISADEERVLSALQEWRQQNKEIPKGKIIKMNKTN
ncbi:hypothetical protein MFLO_05340 [Listeria floridensis FSL S10-1187]|uniref:DUF4176 domain-containing protein n=1 Tax=Listeria floridensis FSL S10-1187 TaxID=1265817 RepID=A0ABP3B1K7_9LIST|nr:DUF4176 domain-containing protein [Listeria floridensis]EUJ33011.1 hypothetical protein MFLO_05340 [Listeria floridensis FSL S10-1187]